MLCWEVGPGSGVFERNLTSVTAADSVKVAGLVPGGGGSVWTTRPHVEGFVSPSMAWLKHCGAS